jgi:hypothetical protein
VRWNRGLLLGRNRAEWTEGPGPSGSQGGQLAPEVAKLLPSTTVLLILVLILMIWWANSSLMYCIMYICIFIKGLAGFLLLLLLC